MKKNKVTAIFLIFALTANVVLFASCAKKEDTKTGGDNSEITTTESISETIPETTKEEADLPELNLGGKDFVIMCNDYSIPVWVQRDIYAEADNGETINDAVFKRNKTIEEKYNCVIKENKTLTLASSIQKYVKAGDNAVDAITVRYRDLYGLASSGCLVEFKNLKYVDLTKSYWDQNCVKMTSICNKLFAVSSDMTIMDNDSTTAMVFNKKLQADYGIEDLYKMVLDGKWTLPKLLELCKVVSIDVDGNSLMDNMDSYGLLYQRDTVTSFLSGCGEMIARKDAEDKPYMTLNTEKAIQVLNSLYDVLYDEMYCFHVMKYFDKKGKDFTEGMNIMFQEDRGLFMWIRMADVENLRSMNTDFGILPIPKYDEQQQNYLHTVNPYVGVASAVPQSAGSTDNSGFILEAMSYESKYTLQPAYYDVCLSTKITRDNESSKMLDIIFGNRAYDIGDIYDFAGIGSDVINMSMTFDKNIVSKYEKKSDKMQKDIEKLIAAYEKIE